MSQFIKTGDTLVVNLQVGESLRVRAVTGTYSARIIAGAASLPVSLASGATGAATYSGYSSAVKIEITSAGLVEYDSGTAPSLSSSGAATPIILAQSGVASSVTGTTSETTLASITIPGGMMGANGSLRITPFFSVTNSANNKTLKVKLGSTAFSSLAVTTSATTTLLVAVRNRGSASSQIAMSSTGVGISTIAPQSGSVDTAVDQVLTITGQLASTGETITLEGYTVEVLPA